MFGIGALELITVVIVIVGAIAIIKIINKAIASDPENARKCLICDYQGYMKSWLGNYWIPQLIALAGLLFYVVPGLLFIAWAWGKKKCPNCGAVAKNAQLVMTAAVPVEVTVEAAAQIKKCPFCAEDIKVDAIKCRYCGSDLHNATSPFHAQ